MRIYRIELENGDGCYRPSDNSKLFSNLASQELEIDYYDFHDYRHPCPSEDSGLDIEHEEIAQYRHGFSSIGQLRTWFYRDDILLMLHRAGYRCAVYEYNGSIPDVYRLGHSQALFKREHFQLVQVIRLDLL